MSASKSIAHAITECEIRHHKEGVEDSDDLSDLCSKNPGHVGFVAADQFAMIHLPQDLQTEEVLNFVKKYIDRTVKVYVRCTSINRPATYPNSEYPYPYSEYRGNEEITRGGSGVMSRRWQFSPHLEPFEFIRGKPCPCPECVRRTSDASSVSDAPPETEYVVVIVTTATHVIYDELEAKAAEFDLTYNSHQIGDEPKRLYGVGLSYNEEEGSEKAARSRTDRVRVKCVSHDPELIQILKRMEGNMRCGIYQNIGNYVIVISHPHGGEKCVTIGNILGRSFPNPHEGLAYMDTAELPLYKFASGTKCRISNQVSSHEIFQQLAAIHGDHNMSENIAADAEHDDEFVLKNELIALIPIYASFLFRFNRLYDNWISFSPETVFSFNGGQNWYEIPGLEVDMNSSDTNLSVPFETGYLLYDAKTCPGSSGAPLLYSEQAYHCVYHSGRVHGGGPNRSTVINFRPSTILPCSATSLATASTS